MQIKFPPETISLILDVGVSTEITAPVTEDEFVIAIEALHSRMLDNKLIAKGVKFCF